MTRPPRIPLATFRLFDAVDSTPVRLLWEPRTGAVWLGVGGAAGETPTLYFSKRRDEIDALVADVWGRRFPKTFEAISRRER